MHSLLPLSLYFLHSFVPPSLPPSACPDLLYMMFNVIYNLDFVDEKQFYKWRDDDQEMFGKGNAIATVKRFFDWLMSDDSQDQT